MKKFVLTAFLCLATLCLPLTASAPDDREKTNEHKSMHAIVMDNGKTGDDHEGAGCTAYAISDHVLLTAEHCNLEGGHLYLDPQKIDGKMDSRFPITVVEKVFDHQDHMLLVVPSVKFKHHIDYDPRLPVQGEHAYFWGNPQLIRDQYREGVVMGILPASDVDGDVDATASVYLMQMTVAGGDSGSSIFGEDGRLIAIVTYGIDDGKVVGAYALAFTKAQVHEAESRK